MVINAPRDVSIVKPQNNPIGNRRSVVIVVRLYRTAAVAHEFD